MRTDQIPALLRRYGSTVTLFRGGQTLQIDAYISPMTHRNRDYLEDRHSPLGYADQNAFYCVAAAAQDEFYPQLGDLVEYYGETLVVSASETMRLYGRPIFAWAVLRRTAGEEASACRI